FGGSAGVWTTCLVFFQSVLLAGYAYADWTTGLGSRRQAYVHVALLAASLATLPIIAASGWKPQGNEEPMLRILLLLGATIGLPYFLLSTTTPLLQAWYWRRFEGSVMLLAVTNHITQNISSVPFLWVLPLAIYLVTFILAFDHPRWYVRPPFAVALVVLLPLMAYYVPSLQLRVAAPIYLVGLFFA